MSRDKYHCPECGKLLKPEGDFDFNLGDKVNFTITSTNGRSTRFKAVKGTIVELLPRSVIVSCKGHLHQVARASVAPSDAPSPLTYALSELCECPKEVAAQATATESNQFAPEL